MGSILTISGVDFSANAVGYNAPNTRGLVGLFLEGGTLAQSVKNLIPGGTSGSSINSPGIGTGFSTSNFATALFNGTIAGTVLTINSFLYGAGNVAVGQVVAGPGVSTATITSLGTGTGSTGTYNLSGSSQTIGPISMSSGSGGGQIVAPVLDTSSFTQIYVVRKNAVSTNLADEAFCGGNITGNASGSGMFLSSSVAAAVMASVSGTPTLKSTAGQAFNFGSTFDMVASVVDSAAVTITAYNLSKGIASAALALGGPPIVGTQSFRLGCSPNATTGSFAGQCDIALAEFHNVALSLSELQAIYAAYKPVMAARSISMV